MAGRNIAAAKCVSVTTASTPYDVLVIMHARTSRAHLLRQIRRPPIYLEEPQHLLSICTPEICSTSKLFCAVQLLLLCTDILYVQTGTAAKQ